MISVKVQSTYKPKSPKLKKVISDYMEIGSTIALSQAKALAPVDTGALKGDLKKETKKNRFRVYTDLVYAKIQEWGGKAGRGRKTTIRGKHYLRDALRVLKKQTPRLLDMLFRRHF